MDERFYEVYAVAAVKGALLRMGRTDLLPHDLCAIPAELMSCEECEAVLAVGRKNGMKIYDFKRSHRDLARVARVLGFLKGIVFSSLLDVGSGRGVFLFPLLDEFPSISVTATDILDARLMMLTDVKNGGIDRLDVLRADITEKPFADKSFDVVTMLEVLEHMECPEDAIRAAVAIARQYVVVSVPSHPDDNPEHIHLLDKDRLSAAFRAAGVDRLSFDGVPGHLILIATIGE